MASWRKGAATSFMPCLYEIDSLLQKYVRRDCIASLYSLEMNLDLSASALITF